MAKTKVEIRGSLSPYGPILADNVELGSYWLQRDDFVNGGVYIAANCHGKGAFINLSEGTWSEGLTAARPISKVRIDHEC